MNFLTTVDFVNINGQRVDTERRVKLEKRVSNAPGEFHKGFIVEGIPPGTLETAMKEHAAGRACELSTGAKRVRPEWDVAAWMAKAKAKRVRTKPYSLVEAANECKSLAEKAGWLRVEIRAMSKGKAT